MKTGYKNGFENALGERENFDENNALPCNFFGLNIRRGFYLKDKEALSVGRETRPTNLEHSPDFSAFKSRELIFMTLDHIDE